MTAILTIVEPYAPYNSSCGYCHNQGQTSFLAASLNAYRMSCSVRHTRFLPRCLVWKDGLLTRQVRDETATPVTVQHATGKPTATKPPKGVSRNDRSRLEEIGSILL
jgi:hypothetical protein